jgi:hypothetical protein
LCFRGCWCSGESSSAIANLNIYFNHNNTFTANQAALGGGIPGAMAMALNVCLLMWLRTTVNYQYKTGVSIAAAFSTLQVIVLLARMGSPADLRRTITADDSRTRLTLEVEMLPCVVSKCWLSVCSPIK